MRHCAANIALAGLALALSSACLAQAAMPVDGMLPGAGPAGVQPAGAGPARWELYYSPYTYHFSRDTEHSGVQLLGLTRVRPDGWLAGGAVFNNSFGQPCTAVFVGRKYAEPWGWKRAYWSWRAGIMYGYKPPYEDKVPLNSHGFSPVFIPAIGYQVTPAVSVQASLLGNSGIMFGVSVELGGR